MKLCGIVIISSLDMLDNSTLANLGSSAADPHRLPEWKRTLQVLDMSVRINAAKDGPTTSVHVVRNNNNAGRDSRIAAQFYR